MRRFALLACIVLAACAKREPPPVILISIDTLRADYVTSARTLSGSTWTQVASSLGSTSTENITYSGTAGTYRWRVYAYSGSGSFSLCSTHP